MALSLRRSFRRTGKGRTCAAAAVVAVLVWSSSRDCDFLGVRSSLSKRDISRRAAETSSKDQPLALVVPGFLGDCGDFEELAEEMRQAGYKAVVAPISWWHWIPCIGGRSMRPILERIDHAVNQAFAVEDGATSVPAPAYNVADFLTDLLNNPGGFLKVGGTDDPAEYPTFEPCGADFVSTSRSKWPATDGQRLALVAHSAAGWISRLYLSNVPYGGGAFDGAEKVHSVVCLGSPHFIANNTVYKALTYLESRAERSLPENVRFLCVGSSGTKAGLASDMTRGAYAFCGAAPDDESVDGDGMTPLFSALAFEPAEKLELDGVTHAPEYPAFGPSSTLAEERASGKPWYGSPEILKKWLPWLQGA